MNLTITHQKRRRWGNTLPKNLFQRRQWYLKIFDYYEDKFSPKYFLFIQLNIYYFIKRLITIQFELGLQSIQSTKKKRCFYFDVGHQRENAKIGIIPRFKFSVSYLIFIFSLPTFSIVFYVKRFRKLQTEIFIQRFNPV